MEFPNTTDDLDDLVGAEISGRQPGWRLRLTRRLGGGGQGNAFLATRFTEGGADPVVVKVWRPSFVLAHPELANLVLKKEYVALARLNDRVPPTPFVVRLLDGGEVSVRMRFASVVLPWLAIEYVHGGALGATLGERVRECVRTSTTALPPARTRRLLTGIVEGLAAIHEVGVVHRDLKPSNVLVCGVGADEMAKVADFGLSRPLGMLSTFGELAVGTPGYAAPEQMDAARVGPWSDVFSLAAVTYFMMTGSDMFEGSATVKMANVYSGTFKSLTERSNVDLGWSRGALQRVENVLRRATRRELSSRIPQIREFWALLEPILLDAESSGSLSIAAGSARTLKDAIYSPWSFQISHREPESLRLRSVAFDPDGHGVGVGETGLWYWEGTRWIRLPPPGGFDPVAMHYLRRLGPSRWLGCGEGGTVGVLTPDQYTPDAAVRGLAGNVTFSTGSVLSERYYALAGSQGGGPPIAMACLDGNWTRPTAIEMAAEVTALAPGPLGEWYIFGRDHDGRGLFASWRAETGGLLRWPVDSAPLYAAATDSTGTVFAVGAGGYAFRRKEGHPSLERVFSHRDLTAMAIDPSGGIWAGAGGRVLFRPPVPAADWSPVWTDNGHNGRFVSIAALAGMVMAADQDGTIVVGHQGLAG